MAVRIRKLILLFAGSAVVAAIAIVIWFSILYRLSLPEVSGTIEVDGVKKPVEITFDSMGIGQVWANSAVDGYFGVGWLHASDRLFQMELIRRLAYGRLSELLGTVTISEDRRQRIIGHVRMAQEAAPRLDYVTRSRLQAYCNGINAYQQLCRAMPFEFYILQIPVEPWTVENCLAVLSFQTWFSDALQNRDKFFLHLEQKMGTAKAQTLLADYPEWAPVTTPETSLIGQLLPAPRRHQDSALPLERAGSDKQVSKGCSPVVAILRRRYGPAIAKSLFSGQSTPLLMTASSNAWVVSPDKSSSGRAVLCCDPHLEVSRLPQFWYFAGLHTVEDSLDVVGITLPGLPFPVMGHNDKAAWAFTAGGVDITDFYREKLNPDDSMQYLTPDGWVSCTVIFDTLMAADSLVALTILETRHGPIVIDNDSLGGVYSLRWAGFDTDLAEAAASALRLASVGSFDQFRSIVTNLGALDANWMYADSSGSIGYQLGTPVPVRPAGADNFPVPGWTDDWEWEGYLPLDQTPHAVNPERGWLANSNSAPSRTVAGNYAADRILSITELLSSKRELSVVDLQGFQLDRTDRYLLRWRDTMAVMLDSIGDAPWADRMRQWDGSTSAESRPAALANIFLSQLTKLTFEDELGELTPQVRKLWLDRTYYSEHENWFDDIGTAGLVESRWDMSLRAMTVAVPLVGDRKWGDILSLRMRHPMAAVPFLGSLLGLERGPWRRGGTAGTLNASFFKETEPDRFETFVAPSFRMVVDFSDINGATVVLPAGNSGNPASEHFFDFYDLWASGGRWNVPIGREAVYLRKSSLLTLTP
ncbi:MAG: penicillin acylase family protein [Candidatus Zixiibacteriota bacterium]